MILYNITFNVELSVVADFKDFLQENHISSLRIGDEVLEYKFLKLLNVDESEAMTMTLQYFLKDLGTYNMHLAVIDSVLKKELYERYGDKVLYFCSVLEKI